MTRQERPLEPDPDLPLIAAFAEGDERAFTTLVNRYGAAIKGYALRMLRNGQQAEEVYVETFLRVAKTRGRFVPRGTVRSYLFTIAHHHCIDLLRQRQRAMAATPELIDLEARRPVRPSPEASLILAEEAGALEKALAALPESHRQVLLLRVVHGLGAAETGEALGLDAGQVDSQLSYARKRLRVLLVEQEDVGATRRRGEA